MFRSYQQHKSNLLEAAVQSSEYPQLKNSDSWRPFKETNPSAIDEWSDNSEMSECLQENDQEDCRQLCSPSDRQWQQGTFWPSLWGVLSWMLKRFCQIKNKDDISFKRHWPEPYIYNKWRQISYTYTQKWSIAPETTPRKASAVFLICLGTL